MDKIIMSRKEIEQATVFKMLETKEMTQVAASKKLNISPRWLSEKYKRYRKNGVEGIIHQGRNKRSPKRWERDDKALLIKLLQTEWKGFGPTFAAEKFNQLYAKKKVSRETVRRVAIEGNLWKPKSRKRKHRKWRERKAFFGELVQLDGSPHDWFEGRGSKCTLLVFIDDATSALLWLEFVPSESFKSIAKATKHYLEKHGRPCSLYTDCGGTFRVNLNNPDGEKITQFERGLKELDINLIHAYSPQAKGRVERVNRTLQDRLVKEMRLVGISTIEEANAFLRTQNYLEKHNRQFAQSARKKGNVHRSLKGYNLYNILCRKDPRILANDFTISYKRRILQLDKHQPTILRPKNEINVHEYLDGTTALYIRNCTLNFKELTMKPKFRFNPVDYVNLHNLKKGDQLSNSVR